MDFYSIVLLIAGLIFLFLGRRLFWLCAALVGLAIGLYFGRELIGPGFLGIVVGILFAVIGGWLAVKFIKIAIFIIGFLIGVLIVAGLLNMFGLEHNIWYWLALLVGGVICAALMGGFFEWGLIIATSVLGAILISDAIDGWLGLTGTVSTIILLVLLVVGIIAQRTQVGSGTPAPTGD